MRVCQPYRWNAGTSIAFIDCDHSNKVINKSILCTYFNSFHEYVNRQIVLRSDNRGIVLFVKLNSSISPPLLFPTVKKTGFLSLSSNGSNVIMWNFVWNQIIRKNKITVALHFNVQTLPIYSVIIKARNFFVLRRSF